MRTTELTWADRIRAEGRVEGREEGRTEGRVEGEAEAVIVLLRERFGAVPAEITQRVRDTRDAATLEALLVRALRIADPAELFA